MGISNHSASKLCLSTSMSPLQLSSPDCEQTVSLSWSQTGYLDENTMPSKILQNFHQQQEEQLVRINKPPPSNPFYFLQNCLFCFWWPSVVNGTCRNDCFVEADYSSAFIDVGYQKQPPDAPATNDRDDPQDLASQSYNTPHHQRGLGNNTTFTLYSPLTQNILFKGRRFSSTRSSQSLIRRRILESEDDDKKPHSSKNQPKLTPLTIDSKASVATSSLNTLHRRTHFFSIGFFTAETLDRIHAPHTGKNGAEQVTPGTSQGQEESKKAFKFDDIQHRRSSMSYVSPQIEIRGRADSETFRNSMQTVTCQKKPNNDDVSPIGSDDGFSTCFSENRKDYHLIGTSPHSRPSSATRYGMYRSRPFDFESVLQPIIQGQHSYDSTKGSDGDVTSPKLNPKADLLGEFLAEDSKRHENECDDGAAPLFFGISFFQSIHSLILQSSLRNPNEESSKEEKENQPNPKTKTPGKSMKLQPNTNSKSCNIKQDIYLHKSPTFIKLLRKSGHRGKCIIQGWVAFRQFASWEEITRHPKRSDFRYIVVLQDEPLLYMFKSKSKQKYGKTSMTMTPDDRETSKKRLHENDERMMKNHEMIEGCTTLELNDDVAIQVKFVSREFGNSICLRHTETGKLLCGMLPLNIPPDAFLDKHHSRLAKGDSLRCIFPQRSKTASSNNRQNRSLEKDGEEARRGNSSSGRVPNEKSVFRSVSKSKKSNGNGPGDMTDRVYVGVEQYDVSRHLLFVLDAAIKFPLPRQSSACKHTVSN